MRPLPQQLGHFIHPLLFEGREHLHLAATRVQSRNRQHLGLFGARELVGLGQHDEELEAFLDPGAHHFEQRLVQLGQAQAGVAQQHDAREAGAADQVIHHHLLPAHLVRARYGGIPIAGQVGQHGVHHPLFAQREQIDVLGTPRLLGGKCQLLLLGEGVDAGGFARVGTAHESDFGHVDGRQVVQLRRGGQEPGGVHPAHGDFGVRCGRERASNWRRGGCRHGELGEKEPSL